MNNPTLTRWRRLEATVHGLVQGVSFRYYTRRTAQQLGVVGWVANQRDGTVRVVAEGPQAALDGLLAFLHEGPSMADVRQVDVTWQPASGDFTQFSVRHL